MNLKQAITKRRLRSQSWMDLQIHPVEQEIRLKPIQTAPLPKYGTRERRDKRSDRISVETRLTIVAQLASLGLRTR